MSKTALSLAAALMAATAISTSAQAGGVRLGFGFPLGVFAASQLMASGPGGGHHDAERPRSLSRSHSEEDAPRRVKRAAPKEEVAEAPVRKAKRAAPKEDVAEAPVRKVKRAAPQEEVAEAPVRKVKRAAPKVDVAEAPAPRPRKLVKTAKLEDTSVANDVTPETADNAAAHTDAMFSQPVPKVEASNMTGTQSTPAAVRIASLAPRKAATTVTTAEPASEPSSKIKITPEIRRLCRKFSAAIAGMIDIPCD
jgi:hypothetical protein